MPADILRAVPPYNQVWSDDPHNHMPSDAPLQFYPWMEFIRDSLVGGDFPEWNPAVLGGVPATPNGMVSSPYYPPLLSLRWLDTADVYNLMVLLHLVIAAVGVYALSRLLGARPLPAWVGGALAMGAGMWVHWSLHLLHLVGMSFLPLALACVHRAVTRPGPASAAGLGAVVGLWWLGGNPQFVFYGTLAAAAYGVAMLLVHRRAGVLLPVATAVGGAVLGAALAAPVLLPSLGVGSEILRQKESAEALAASHLPPTDLIQLVLPAYRGDPIDEVLYRPYPGGVVQLDTPFVGVSALILAVAGVAWRRRPERLLLAALAVGALVLAFTGWPHRILHDVLPGYDRFRATSRWLAVVPAFVAPLAAVGLSDLTDGDGPARRRLWVAVGAVTAALAVLAAVVGADGAAPHRYFAKWLAAAAAPAALLGAAAFLAVRRPRAAVALGLAAVLLEVTLHTPRWYSRIEEDRAYPQVAVATAAQRAGGRIIRAGPALTQLGPFAADIPMTYGIDDAQGWSVLFPTDVDRYLRLVDDYGTFAAETNTAPPVRRAAGLASPLLDAFDVRTIVAFKGTPVPGYPKVVQGDPEAYRRPSLGPAAVVGIADNVGTEEMWRRVADPDWEPGRTAAVVGLRQPVRGNGGTVRLEERTSDSERWRVRSDGAGLLRVSGRFASDWRATVDQKPVPVLRADGIFRAVPIPDGNHVVTFSYRNRAAATGLKVASVGLVVLLGLLAVGQLRPTSASDTDARPPTRRWRVSARRP